ncbi:hypothetical protein GCM10007103_01580 [Salinimicrobium marinum]|uniref:Uncharacterized protein n=2 Tax=Salinimicrobium marinum TaxID=680283 RepID=A0A918S4U4_9FLAO|nr:hypothetical protein GCM10007103_01580 [Salinimicrobium marinum]
MLIFFLLALLSDIIFPVLVILIMPIPLYFLFRGEVALKVAAGKLRVTWIKKPAFVKLKDSEIQLYEVIRWKLQRNNRGPEIFTIILKSGKKLHFRPDLFSVRDWNSELWQEFDNEMRKFYSDTSEEDLYKKIFNSGYIANLDNRIKLVKHLNFLLIALGLLSLFVMIAYREYETALSVGFLSVFILLAGLVIYYHYLKNERKQTLKR